jgi:hypothetical protein
VARALARTDHAVTESAVVAADSPEIAEMA